MSVSAFAQSALGVSRGGRTPVVATPSSPHRRLHAVVGQLYAHFFPS